MTLREWSRTHGITKADIARVVVIKRLRERKRYIFILPNGDIQARPRAMLAALEARFPGVVQPVIDGEPIGQRFLRTMRFIWLNRPAIKAGLKMEEVG